MLELLLVTLLPQDLDAFLKIGVLLYIYYSFSVKGLLVIFLTELPTSTFTLYDN